MALCIVFVYIIYDTALRARQNLLKRRQRQEIDAHTAGHRKSESQEKPAAKDLSLITREKMLTAGIALVADDCLEN